MIELTDKEIKSIGFNRYFYKARKYWLSITLIVIGFTLTLIFTKYTDNKMNDYIQGLIGLVIFFAFFIPFLKRLTNSEKEGKKFLEQWKKEKLGSEINQRLI